MRASTETPPKASASRLSTPAFAYSPKATALNSILSLSTRFPLIALTAAVGKVAEPSDMKYI